MAVSDLVDLSGLMDDAKCFAFIRQRPLAGGHPVPCLRKRRGDPGETGGLRRDDHDDAQPCQQRHRCKACSGRFEDLSGTVLAGHHQPLRMWVLCLYFMGLDTSDPQAMTKQLRRGLPAKVPAVELQGEVEPDARTSRGIDGVYVVAGHKGQPAAVAKRNGSGAAASWHARRAVTLWRRTSRPSFA